ncbi:uncharacterized protein [Rutidosis leptorrhynchoides]|uniref:uncharacterized protein n=1 Tax=Rutidosis leptorrhynchoides TaxID=125765 RepID=UPI003A99BAE1
MAPTQNYDKLYTVTLIHHLIQLKLDLTKLNYTHWSTLFANHCAAFNVESFLVEASTSDPPSEETKKADAVVLGWIYLTISEPLLERLLNTQPKSSYEAWEFLKKVFLDNKCSKTIELTAELRSLNIGDQTAEAYFHKIDSIVAMLTNLDANMKEEELVTYAINGLNNRFPQKRINNDSPGTPSAPSILLAQATTSSPNAPRPHQNNMQVCRNFNRGQCRFGERYQYLHQAQRNSFSNSSPSSGPNRGNHNSQAQLLGIIVAQQHYISQQQFNRSNTNDTLYPQFGPRPLLPHTTCPPGFPNIGPQANYVGSPTIAALGPAYSPHQTPNVPPLNAPVYQAQGIGPSSSILGPPPAYGFSNFQATPQPTQATVMPHAFATNTLPDYGNLGWTMDTGAPTHLTSRINNLSTIFNHCIYPYVVVGDGNSIPVVNTGHSILPNPNRPLHLSNVLVTPNIVKNLISVHRFTRDNKVSISFEEFGFSVKDYWTQQLLL